MSDNKSEIHSDAFQLEGENLKVYQSRNVDLETHLKAGIAEDPEEETKSDRAAAQQKTKNPEDSLQQYATIADNLPASATEIDPPIIKQQEEDHNTLIANPEDGKILEDT